MKFLNTLIITSAVLFLTTVSKASVMTPPPPPSKVFTVSGVFQDGAVLGGTFDLTNGQITSANMTISGIAGVFTLDWFGGGNYQRPAVWANVDLNDGGNFLSLALMLQPGQKTLQNYNGGALCDATSYCGDTVSYYVPDCDRDPILSKGSVTAAPEPGSPTLLGAGLCAVGLFMRKRFNKKQITINK